MEVVLTRTAVGKVRVPPNRRSRARAERRSRGSDSKTSQRDAAAVPARGKRVWSAAEGAFKATRPPLAELRVTAPRVGEDRGHSCHGARWLLCRGLWALLHDTGRPGSRCALSLSPHDSFAAGRRSVPVGESVVRASQRYTGCRRPYVQRRQRKLDCRADPRRGRRRRGRERGRRRPAGTAADCEKSTSQRRGEQSNEAYAADEHRPATGTPKEQRTRTR